MIRYLFSKRIFIIVPFLCVSFMFIGFSSNTNSRYNKSPDLSKKIVGSENDKYFMTNLESFDQVVYFSDLIVKGHVIGEPIQEYKSLDYISLNEKVNEVPQIPVSLVNFKIDEVIKGDIQSDEIVVLQEGLVYNDNSLETKLYEDGSYILFLISTEFEGKNVYSAYRKEVGIVKLNESDINTNSKSISLFSDSNDELDVTTYSLSKDLEMSKYDDIPINIIEEDIQTSLDATDDLSYDDAVKKYYGFELD